MGLQRKMHGTWAGRWTFIFAATGSAVGLGNIWKFPYIAGENGGGAFVLVYLLCIAVIGLPVMMAEVLLGRRARLSPIHGMQRLAQEAGANRSWSLIGWSGALAGLLILTFYSVVAGWSLAYVSKSLSGEFINAAPETIGAMFETFLADKGALIQWHLIFTAATVAVVAAGVTKGIGVAVRVLMPLLFVMLLILLGYSAQEGNFAEGARFLFHFKFDQLTWDGVLVALGHAFFTLSLGMGAIMAYGAYMPEQAHVSRTVITVALLDTLVALVAGLAIFPIVFANPVIEPGSGPGLLFVSLPVAFGNMTGGLWFGTLFFSLVAIAALSSAISLIEPAVAWLVEAKRFKRVTATCTLGALAWLIGLGSVLSFNDWDGYRVLVSSVSGFEWFVSPEQWANLKQLTEQHNIANPDAVVALKGLTYFDFFDFLTANIMLPLGGLFITLFVGWKMSRAHVREEMAEDSDRQFNLWLMLMRFVSPVLVGLIFVILLWDMFFAG